MRIVLINVTVRKSERETNRAIDHDHTMNLPTKKTTADAGFIRSRKHVRTLPGPALAMLAGLGLPFAAAAHADEPDSTVPVVQVSGVQQGQSSANSKFTAPLLDTPKSVTVVPAEVISQTAATSLTDALRTVPGITIGAAEGGNPVGDNLFIRGYNAQTDTYVDGIRDPGSQSREIFDVEQVEVVKGPNSALGGRSSAGGGNGRCRCRRWRCRCRRPERSC